MDFFKKAFLELQHVVWPTRRETTTYMNYNIAIIVVMTIFLSLLGFLFREGLVQAKYIVNPDSRNAVNNLEAQQTAAQEENLQSMYEQFGLSGSTNTGAVVEVLSGATVEISGDSDAVVTPEENTTQTGA